MPIWNDNLELSWFDAGSGIFDGIVDDPGCYPPLDDREIQRQWLGGFVGAWAELTMFATADPRVDPRQRPVLEVLADKLADRPDLLQQLRALGAAR